MDFTEKLTLNSLIWFIYKIAETQLHSCHFVEIQVISNFLIELLCYFLLLFVFLGI